jgi:hypothetical protein
MNASVVDSVLAQHGLVWKTSPYRIEDRNGARIQSGPIFDLSERALKYQSQAIRRDEIKFRSSSTRA